LAKLLIVDDHPLYREGVIRTLSARPLYAGAVGVATSEDALRALDEDPSFDLVLVDRKLSRSDGLDLLREIGARHPDVARMLTSADASVAVMMAAVKAGAQGFVPKDADRTRARYLRAHRQSAPQGDLRSAQRGHAGPSSRQGSRAGPASLTAYVPGSTSNHSSGRLARGRAGREPVPSRRPVRPDCERRQHRRGRSGAGAGDVVLESCWPGVGRLSVAQAK